MQCGWLTLYAGGRGVWLAGRPALRLTLEEARRGNDVAPLAQNGLDHHRRRLRRARGLLQQLLDGLDGGAATRSAIVGGRAVLAVRELRLVKACGSESERWCAADSTAGGLKSNTGVAPHCIIAPLPLLRRLTRWQRAVSHAVHALGRRHRQRRQRPAVEPALEVDDVLATRLVAGELHGALHGLGAGACTARWAGGWHQAR